MKTIELLEFKTKMLRGKMRIKVVGRSPGITERDIDEIYERIESITILSPSSMNIMHIYYHHLSSNSSVIARLIPIPSAREMRDLHDMAYVQCLVVSPEALADFGNNPVLLYQTMLSNDAFEAFSTRYMTLKTIESWEKIPPIDVDFIRGLVVGIGRHELMVFLQSVLSAASTGFAGQTANLYLLSGTYQFLPMAWRRELTFTVGIPFINERCFRAVGIVPSSLSHVIVDFHKQHYPPCIDFDEVTEGPDYPITDGWASFINQILLDGQYSYIISKLPKVDFPSKENGENYTPTTEEVNRLGLKLLADYMEQRGDVPPADSSFDQKETEDTLQVRKRTRSAS